MILNKLILSCNLRALRDGLHNHAHSQVYDVMYLLANTLQTLAIPNATTMRLSHSHEK